MISVTNRLAAAPAQEALQAQAKKQYGVDLTIHEQRWLVMQLHRRDNLDLLGEYLHLPPPRPRFFLDLSEFEHLLEGRGLLAAPFAGRREELDEVERLLADQGRAVIIEAPGGSTPSARYHQPRPHNPGVHLPGEVQVPRMHAEVFSYTS